MTIIARREIKFEPITGDVISAEYMRRMQTVISDHIRKLYDSIASTDVDLSSSSVLYFGDVNTNGTWKIVRSGNNLSVQRRESGSYVEKGTFTP